MEVPLSSVIFWSLELFYTKRWASSLIMSSSEFLMPNSFFVISSFWVKLKKRAAVVFESRIAEVVAAKVGGVGTTASSQNGCPSVQRNTNSTLFLCWSFSLTQLSVYIQRTVFFSINGAAVSFPSCNCSCPPSL